MLLNDCTTNAHPSPPKKGILSYTCRVTKSTLVSVHRHPLLRTPAEFPLGRGRDGPAATGAGSAGLLEGKQLLRTECLVVDLRSCLDEVLQMGTREEISQVHELAVALVLD